MSSRSTSSRKVRLSCRMDKGLMIWIQWYAQQRGTTVTQIIKEHFQELRKKHSVLNRREVDQI